MHVDAVGEGAIEGCQRLRLVFGRLGPGRGQGLDPPAFDDAALGHHHGFARQDAMDALEDGFAAGGELQLQQLVARGDVERRLHQAAADERLGLGGEGQALRRLDIIKRLDAERIAGQHQPPGAGIVQGDGVHAAQMTGEVEPEAAIEMQRQFAIGAGGEDRGGKFPLELDVVVDLAVRDQRRAPRLVKRLVAGGEIDDGEPRLHHAHVARAVMAVAVGPAMAQRAFHGGERGQGRRLAVHRHHAGDAAHQRAARSKKSR